MDMQQVFQDLGVDAITGSELMGLLQISTDDFHSPQRFSKFKEVIDYFKQFSPDSQRFLVNKATQGKLVDRLDHIYEYTRLLESRSQLEQTLGAMEKERDVIDQSGDIVLQTNLAERQMELRQKLGRVSEEIGIYEK